MSDAFWNGMWIFAGIVISQFPLIIAAFRASRKIDTNEAASAQRDTSIKIAVEKTREIAQSANAQTKVLQDQQRKFIEAGRTDALALGELNGIAKGIAKGIEQEKKRASQFVDLNTSDDLTNFSDMPPR